MLSAHTTRLVRLTVRAVTALVATLAATVAVWYGGLSALTWLGVTSPARGETGTIIGIGATAAGSSAVPGWLVLREYLAPETRESGTASEDTPDHPGGPEVDAGTRVKRGS